MENTTIYYREGSSDKVYQAASLRGKHLHDNARQKSFDLLHFYSFSQKNKSAQVSIFKHLREIPRNL